MRAYVRNYEYLTSGYTIEKKCLPTYPQQSFLTDGSSLIGASPSHDGMPVGPTLCGNKSLILKFSS